MKKFVALTAVLATVVAVYATWHILDRPARAAEILDRSDLENSSVSYSWTGGFSLANRDVHAHFLGNGQATLQIGDNEPVRTTISMDRYRELLSCMAENDFAQIKAKRRWGAYQCDIGRWEVTLRHHDRETIVYADEKHFVDKPEHLEPILEKIYAFDAEFGQSIDYGPIATTCIRDTQEIIAAIVGSVCLFGCAAVMGLFWIRKKSKNRGTAEPGDPLDVAGRRTVEP